MGRSRESEMSGGFQKQGGGVQRTGSGSGLF